MGQQRLERFRGRLHEKEEVEGSEEEKEGGGIAETLNNLTIETAGKEGEAADVLEAVLEMEVEEESGTEGEE